MNRIELLELVHAKVQEQTRRSTVPKVVVERTMDVFMSEIKKAVANGETVQLVGFGTFKPADRAAKEARNPQTGEIVQIPAKKAVVFKAGKPFKDMLNK